MKEFLTHLTKMAKCMIYIGSYACGECYGNSFTPSPRRSHPLDGSAITDTIQQLLEGIRAAPSMVPMPLFRNPPGGAGVGYAFALCDLGKVDNSVKKTKCRTLHPSIFHRIANSVHIKNNISAWPVQFLQRSGDRWFVSHAIAAYQEAIQENALLLKGRGKAKRLTVFQNLKFFVPYHRCTRKRKTDCSPVIRPSIGFTVTLYKQRKLIVVTFQSKFCRLNSAPVSRNRGCRNPCDQHVTALVFNFPSRNFMRQNTSGHCCQESKHQSKLHISNAPSGLVSIWRSE